MVYIGWNIDQENAASLLLEQDRAELLLENAQEGTYPHVTVGTGTIGTRFINKDYPNTVGLTAGTTKQQTNPSLEEQ